MGFRFRVKFRFIVSVRVRDGVDVFTHAHKCGFEKGTF